MRVDKEFQIFYNKVYVSPVFYDIQLDQSVK